MIRRKRLQLVSFKPRCHIMCPNKDLPSSPNYLYTLPFFLPHSHKHFRNLQQTLHIIRHPSHPAHTRQIRPAPIIPRPTPGIIPLPLITPSGSRPPNQLLQPPRQPNPKRRKDLRQRPTRQKRQNNQHKHLNRMPAHVVIQIPQEPPETMIQPARKPAPRTARIHTPARAARRVVPLLAPAVPRRRAALRHRGCVRESEEGAAVACVVPLRRGGFRRAAA